MVRRQLRELVTTVTDTGIATGVQLFGATSNQVVDLAFGADHRGEPMQPDQLYGTYCLTKPLVPLGLALLEEADTIRFDANIGSLLPQCAIDARLTIRDLLTHRAGLMRPTKIECQIWSDDVVEREMLGVTGAPGVAEYSDYAAWWFLVRVLEAVTEQPSHRFIQQRILEPLGLADEIVFPEVDEAEATSNRMGVPVGTDDDRQFPLLAFLLPPELARVRPVTNALTTARAVGRLYQSLLAVYDGASVEGLPRCDTLHRLLALRRGGMWDATLARDCDFAGGFMLDAARHGISLAASPESFGHSSGYVLAFAYADPVRRLVASVMINSAFFAPELAWTMRTSAAAAVEEALAA
jgi:CubicO group peptidase (beta-lactamase class C family)